MLEDIARALIDAVVDNYFMILEKLGETIEEIEEKLVTNPTSETLHTLHDLKREMIFLRKSVWPLREVINRLERSESPLINKSTYVSARTAFIELLDSKYMILAWNAMAIIANLAKVDTDQKFDAIFDKYYGFLNNDYMVTVVGNSGKIALAKLYLLHKITAELLKVENISVTPHLTRAR